MTFTVVRYSGCSPYLLLKRDTAGVYQATTKKGTKTSFCIIDYVRMTTAGPTWGQYGSCSGTYQGLSVGWGDT
ncbi:MAG: hypothetical protein M3Q71_22135 [Chloroflexota bacterium]|nr:hypothetical protein [Chloroflexota bacterium]